MQLHSLEEMLVRAGQRTDERPADKRPISYEASQTKGQTKSK